MGFIDLHEHNIICSFFRIDCIIKLFLEMTDNDNQGTKSVQNVCWTGTFYSERRNAISREKICRMERDHYNSCHVLLISWKEYFL